MASPSWSDLSGLVLGRGSELPRGKATRPKPHSPNDLFYAMGLNSSGMMPNHQPSFAVLSWLAPSGTTSVAWGIAQNPKTS